MNASPFRGSALVATDLDGTLLTSERTLASSDLQTLARLGDHNVVRVIATGRSWHSAKLVLGPTLPIDYLAFSSGAGVVDWSSGALIYSHHLEAAEAAHALRVLVEMNVSCMVHDAVPENHRFSYWRGTRAEPNDFDERLARYEEYAVPLDADRPWSRPACQLLGVLARDELSTFEAIQARLPSLNVFRSTSPLDHSSIWVEIFPKDVCKASATAWLAERHQVSHQSTLAIGNDFNDLDLLDWASSKFVVSNAAPALRSKYAVVRSNDEGGFSHAVSTWETTR